MVSKQLYWENQTEMVQHKCMGLLVTYKHTTNWYVRNPTRKMTGCPEYCDSISEKTPLKVSEYDFGSSGWELPTLIMQLEHADTGKSLRKLEKH
jgi:hypothetical protein